MVKKLKIKIKNIVRNNWGFVCTLNINSGQQDERELTVTVDPSVTGNTMTKLTKAITEEIHNVEEIDTVEVELRALIGQNVEIEVES